MSDERIAFVIQAYQLGLPETSDIIRQDSWMYAAFKFLQGYHRLKMEAEWERKRTRGK